MDRSDAEQEGVTLPAISTTRMIAREEANAVILQHLSLCPFSKSDVEKRLRVAETTLAKLIGFMIGAGILGGSLGSALTEAFSRL